MAVEMKWAAPVDIAFTAGFDGTEQRYIRLQPANFDPERLHDVLLAFHGHGSDRWQYVREERGECAGARDVAARHGMLFITPDYRGNSWMGPAAEADIVQLIAELRAQYRVDRVILVGGSMGGTSVLTFAARQPALIKALFSVDVVATMFIIGGVVFLIAEKYYKPKEHFINDVEKVSYKQAFLIGLAQVAGLVPGTSRAGSTILGAMFVGLTRKASAEFSFLLAFPVMSAATGYSIVKNYSEFNVDNLIVLGVGFVVAFITAYFTIKLFLRFLENFTFVSFGIYRIIFGVALLAYY